MKIFAPIVFFLFTCYLFLRKEILMQQGQQTAERPRYSRSNPPKTVQEATERMDRLDADINSIEMSLKHTTIDSFAEAWEYERWKRRAIAALGYTKAESKFLQEYVKGPQNVTNGSGWADKSQQGNLPLIAEGIRRRVREMVEEFEAVYIPHYSHSLLPVSMEEAHARVDELTIIRRNLQAAFMEVTGLWNQHPLRRGDLSGVKAPLQRILNEVEAESSAIKSFMRKENSTQSFDGWKKTCVTALVRATTSGFVLTEEESAVLSRLRLQLNI